MVSLWGKNFFSVVILLFSMESLYFYNIKMAPVPFVALGILFLIYIYTSKWVFHRTIYSVFVLWVVVIILVISSGLGGSEQNFKSAYGVCFSLFAALLASKFDNVRTVEYGLWVYLRVHAIFIFIQFFFLLAGVHFDYLEWITGESQRVGTGTFEVFGWQLLRPTGLFNEPGTFSAFYLPVLLLWLILVGKLRRLDWLLIATPLFTFSLFSFVIWGVFIPLVLIRRGFARINSFFFWVFVLVCFSIFYLFYEYIFISLERKISIDNISDNQLRILFLKEQIMEQWNTLFWIGNGFPLNVGFAFNGEQWVVNDSGLIFWFVWSFGFLLSFLFVFLIFWAVGFNFFLIPLIAVILSKLSITYPFAVFFISLIVVLSKKWRIKAR
jgi:hypothetical protein